MRQAALLLLISLLVSLPMHATVKSTGIPQIINYANAEIPAGSQTWMINVASDGLAYFANNDGVLVFDGISWRVHNLPNRTVVRSVKALDGKIYAGGFNEIGYFEANKSGILTFNSLQQQLPENLRDFGEVWKIHALNGAIVFQSFEQLMIYGDGQFITLKAPVSFHFSFVVNDKLYINDQVNGLYQLENNQLVPLAGTSALAGKLLWSMLPHGDDMLIATADDGLYRYKNQQLTPWNTPVAALLKQKQIYCAYPIDDENLAFGTIQDGLVISDFEGNITQHINLDQGLQNNTVLSMTIDHWGNLWLGLDNGIDYVEINSPLTYFTYSNNLSAGYSAVLHNGILYLGTNRGVFYHNWKSLQTGNTGQKFKLIPQTQGQVWDLTVIDETLFCGHNSGIFIIEDTVAQLISEVQGAWSFVKPEQQNNIILSGTYTRLVKLQRINGSWKEAAIISGFKESSRFLINAGPLQLWMSHGYKGVFKIHLNETFDTVVQVEHYDSRHGFPADKNIRVCELFGKAVFTTGEGYYSYGADSNIFQLDLELNKIIANGKANLLKADDKKNIWYFTNEEAGVYRLQEDGSYVNVDVPFRELKGKYIRWFQMVYPIDEQHVLIGLQNGFAHYTQDFQKNYRKGYNALIRSVDLPMIDSLIYGGNKNLNSNEISLPYQLNQLHFTFSAVDFENPKMLQFSSRLEGFEEEWTAWQSEANRQFTNLRHGDYTFRVKAINVFGYESEEASISFTIMPPWYFSWWAFSVYVLLLLSAIYVFYKYLKNRIKKSKKLFAEEQEKAFLEREKQLQTETLKAEKEVIRLRNEKLRQEMVQKDKELANSTMQMIHKSKSLTYLKRELQILAKETKNDTVISRIRSMTKRINRDIDTDKQWEVFESHFESVHEEFLKRLKQQYPELSPRELKLCAYLRLNISSKEIASLMNISVRGVEISRYRLRKKLSLEHDQNLTDFIMMF
ncbi:MAG: triple tyrosine motif-containing protein [Bacteroidetes bacterium]|jgi:DNA-binding CsgD family transcriptional regulator|nr:triple tyrosine motif-containing protein [Bacteroidota bacterium]